MSIKNLTQKAYDWILSRAKDTSAALSPVTDTVKHIGGAIQDLGGSFVDSIKETIKETTPVYPILDNVGSAIKQGVSGVKDFISNPRESVKNAVHNMAGSIKDFGKYVYVPGSAAPTSGDAMDYATWLQGHTKYQAEQDRIRAEQQAERDRQRQIVDANSAYMQGRALYGANAERMASMGLTNSGYGEYLTGKAYATQRGEVQNANATAAARKDRALYEEGQKKILADQQYAADLLGIQNDRDASYASWMSGIKNGELNIDDIKSIPSYQNLTAEQKQSLINAQSAMASKKADAAFDSFLAAINDGSYNLSQIMAMDTYQNLTKEQKDMLTEADKKIANAKDQALLDSVSGSVDSYSRAELDSMVANGTISAEAASKAKKEQDRTAYNAIVYALNSGTLTKDTLDGLELAYSNGNIGSTTYNDAKKLLENTAQGILYQYENNELTAKQFVEKMNDAGYGSGGTVKGGWYISGLGSGKNNDEVYLTIGSTTKGDDKIRLSTGKKIEDKSLIKELNKLASGDENESPSTKGESMFGDSFSSDEKSGKLVMYEGKLYLYTTYGWKNLKAPSSGAGNDTKAIAAWMALQIYNSIDGR